MAVIGSGLMGVGIAQIFAVAGHGVTLMDSDAARLPGVPGRLEASLTEMAQSGAEFASSIPEILARVQATYAKRLPAGRAAIAAVAAARR